MKFPAPLQDLVVPPRAARFGAFVLAPARRRLLRDGQPVRLSDRALDLLVALVQRRGEVVSKQQLLALAWPGLVVEESNLRVQVAALRRALEDPPEASRYVASVPGRGYAFVGDVAWEADADEAEAPPAVHPTPAIAARPLVGRDDELSAVRYELALRRLITLAGPGGIGKTAVARAVAARVAASYADGVRLLDLAPLGNAELVLPHLASQLRIPAGGDALDAVVEHLRPRHLLLVLDNCEHVVDAVCPLAREILGRCEGVDILATSREALRAAGEYVKRLQPLAVPPDDTEATREAVLGFAAARLLLERIEAQDVRLALNTRELALLCGICRRLDGLPLALELAASWVPVLGLQGVYELLDQRLSLLRGGQRDAEPRHRTLAATIDWSYDALDAEERALFQQLAVFRGAFTLEAVEGVCSHRGGPAWERRALELLGRLVDKSLVSVELSEQPPRYRLFEALRRYALDKLQEAGALRAACEAHARQVLAHCRGAMADPLEMPSPEGLRRQGGDIADIRAALDWAFGADGDVRLGIALVVASTPCWFGLLLVPELQSRLEQAIATARALDLEDEDALMRLHVALGHAAFHAGGPSPAVREVLEQALRHAQAAGAVEAQREILWALFDNDSSFGDYVAMGHRVEAMRGLWAAHPAAQPLLERVSALDGHLRGDQAAALRHAQAALAAVQCSAARSRTLLYDHRTATGSHQARALWVAGCADQAAEVVAATAETARLIEQPFAQGYFLVFGACPVSIWRGDLATAWRHVDALLDVASGIAFNVWRGGGQFFARLLRALQALGQGASVGAAAVLGDAAPTPYQAHLLASIDHRLLPAAALAAPSADAPSHWATAELLRARGERLLREGGVRQQDEAAALFEQALVLAHGQGALAWELRAACSLARLHREGGRRDVARRRLSETYGRFTEGFETQDLRQACALLHELEA